MTPLVNFFTHTNIKTMLGSRPGNSKGSFLIQVIRDMHFTDIYESLSYLSVWSQTQFPGNLIAEHIGCLQSVRVQGQTRALEDLGFWVKFCAIFHLS